jgi:sulfate adenylyltransferase subunit 2
MAFVAFGRGNYIGNFSAPDLFMTESKNALAEPTQLSSYRLTHLKMLEAESIHIIREVAAEFKNPVMLYSVGKDSSVMVQLALKAFYPDKPPFPLMHVDTTWKFQAMYQFREEFAKRDLGLNVITYINQEGLRENIDPFVSSGKHTTLMKTEGLKKALDQYQFDAAFGGARRDEEKSRAKERVFSFRDQHHRWDPKNQRPELWNLYNARINPGESIRVFPLSNWTELDVWQYIHLEQIPIVPLYFKSKSASSAFEPSAAIRSPARSSPPRARCPRSSRKCCWPRPPSDKAA